MSTDFAGRSVLILGAGVTGKSVAKVLASKGARIALVDESLDAVVGFPIIALEEIDFAQWEFVVVSPGWKANHPVLVSARKAGIEILNEVDIAWGFVKDHAPHQKWLAVTGTNGKTTTVEMVASALRSGGYSAIACGNVGDTVIEAVVSSEKFDYLVLELSSFQLHWMREAKFEACAILNIADDHIDWHGTFDDYAKAKISLLQSSQLAILNGDDGEVVVRSREWRGRKVFYTLNTPAPGELGVVEELLVDRAFVMDPQEAQMIAELIDVQPSVPHNVSNALAAAGLALAVGVSHEAIRSALQSFRTGRHRIELIAQVDGISWIDDSKATNPHAASASLASFLSVIWIAGGLAKGASMDELVQLSKGRIKVAILIGQDRKLISDALHRHAPSIPIFEIGEGVALMERVVALAKLHAISGDAVLLAPACASMDQFLSYADRGDRFADAVRKVIGNGK